MFVPAGNSTALSKALLEVLRDPERRAAMGRHNRELVERTMSWDRVVEQLEQIYEITIQRFSSSGTAIGEVKRFLSNRLQVQIFIRSPL